MQKRNFYKILIFTLSYWCWTLNAQQLDTAKVYDELNFLAWVKKFHPVIQQANLLNGVGEAYELKAKGGFDPKFFGNIERKFFDGKTYFTIGGTGLKIPSWLGLEFKAGYDWTNGIFLNPEINLPTAGQAYTGLKWSVGRGLIIDERRAVMEKAKLLQEANRAEQQFIINDLLLIAGKAYWEWVQAYNDWQIYQEGLQLAEVRLEGVRNSFLQGDKPAIDTLESLILVQNRQMLVNEALVNYENASRVLSNFLWYQNELPLEVSELLKPPHFRAVALDRDSPGIQELIKNLRAAHPELRQIELKRQQLEVDRKLKREQLKPMINVEFNFLANGWDFVNPPKNNPEINEFNALFTQNYKAGVHVGMPIFLRKERGDLELTDLKLVEMNLKLRQKTQEIRNKILNYEAQLNTASQQVEINKVTLDNYSKLLEAENEKFRFGESSIFLLNSREQKLMDANLKLVKFITSYHKNRLGLIWSTGLLQ